MLGVGVVVCVCSCVRVYDVGVRACVRTYLRVCVCAYVRACVRVFCRSAFFFIYSKILDCQDCFISATRQFRHRHSGRFK